MMQTPLPLVLHVIVRYHSIERLVSVDKCNCSKITYVELLSP